MSPSRCKDTVSQGGQGKQRRPCRMYGQDKYDGYCQSHWPRIIDMRMRQVGHWLLKSDRELFNRIMAKIRENQPYIK